MDGKVSMTPIVSKLYCSSSLANFLVRRRPPVINGGGFIVMDYAQKVIFKVDGCGTLGVDGELILRDGGGESLLLIRRKGGIVQALSLYQQWKGYRINFEGAEKKVFVLKEPVSCFVKNIPIRITTEPRRSYKDWDFEIKGSFADKACTILDSRGNLVAQVGGKEAEKALLSNDVYNVMVQPGCDQAFVFGVIAVLDDINHESTRC